MTQRALQNHTQPASQTFLSLHRYSWLSVYYPSHAKLIVVSLLTAFY